jgi:hypothetical protein
MAGKNGSKIRKQPSPSAAAMASKMIRSDFMPP